MIATQASVFSVPCASAVSFRASRTTRPACVARPVRSSTKLNAGVSAKGLGSFGLGAQQAKLLRKKTQNVASPMARRSDLRVRAAAGDSDANPLIVGVLANIMGAIKAVAAVVFYLASTMVCIPLMALLALWAPIGLLLEGSKKSVGNVWAGISNLFWFPLKTPKASTASDITEAEVLECQGKWANAIKTISKTYLDKGDYIAAAAEAAGELYGYGHSKVLFKPTKAAEFPFRPTGEEAMSYFVGGDVVKGGYKEDAGFAINGGKGWADVVFTNHDIEINGPTAIAMGSYVFTCATSGDKVKVEYTFGYKRNEDGKNRIFLHHSSVPYSA